MVGSNYVKSGRGWLIHRGRRLQSEKTRNRQPYYRQEINSVPWMERRIKRMLSGEILRPSPLPCGVEIARLDPTKLEFCVCLPEGNLNRDFHLSYWDLLDGNAGHFDRSVMADIFTISTANSKLTAVCALDFLDRILNLKPWDGTVNLTLKNFARPDAFYAHVESQINGGVWDFEREIARVLKTPQMSEIEAQKMKSFGSPNIEAACIATIRHRFTPYDYLWQTKKKTIVEAQSWADWASNLYSEILNA